MGKMKKDIKWLKEEIGELPCVDTVFNSGGSSYIDSAVPVMVVYDLIDQLDEPEVLSQEWIDKHTYYEDEYDFYYADPDELKNLLVPKQEITFDQVHDKLREESILSEKSFDYYWNCINDNVEIDEPGNLIVPKQELPVIPEFAAEFIEEVKASGDSLDDAFSILRGIYHQSEVADWAAKEKRNSETLARAWVDGYEVEEEQDYYVSVSDEEYGGFWFLFKKNNGGISIGVNRDWSEVDWDTLKLTEQEIKDYDPRYWAFAKPVE